MREKNLESRVVKQNVKFLERFDNLDLLEKVENEVMIEINGLYLIDPIDILMFRFENDEGILNVLTLLKGKVANEQFCEEIYNSNGKKNKKNNNIMVLDYLYDIFEYKYNIKSVSKKGKLAINPTLN